MNISLLQFITANKVCIVWTVTDRGVCRLLCTSMNECFIHSKSCKLNEQCSSETRTPLTARTQIANIFV